MRLLDTFCGAGGCSMGYYRAGFEVEGVDIEPQPHYPFKFHQANALEFITEHGHDYDVIHASPPCQDYSSTKSLHENEHPDLIGPVRRLLIATEKPYIIENVVGAPLDNPLLLCGSSFGLGVRRHRLFETYPLLLFRPFCLHHEQDEPLDVTGTGGWCPRHHKPRSIAEAQKAMGIEWMTRQELNQAIPPAYTEWIGRQLMEILTRPEALPSQPTACGQARAG